MTVTEKYHRARELVAAKHTRELDARPGGGPSRRLPAAATPSEQRPSAPTTGPPQLLSQHDLRQFYGINFSRQHLWRLTRAGVLPRPVALGIGKFARKAFRREDIEAYVASLSYVGDEGKAA